MKVDDISSKAFAPHAPCGYARRLTAANGARCSQTLAKRSPAFAISHPIAGPASLWGGAGEPPFGTGLHGKTAGAGKGGPAA